MDSEVQTLLRQSIEKYDNDYYQDALAGFQQVVLLAPTDVVCCAWLARALIACGQYERAIETANRAIQLDGSSPLGFAHRAWALWAGHKDATNALADCQKAIGCDPREPTAYLVRGFILQSQNRPDKARQDADRVIQLTEKGTYLQRRGYYLRALLLYNARDTEAYLVARALCLGPREYLTWDSQEQNTLWCSSLARYTDELVLPRIRSAGERYVHHWPAYFLWGQSEHMEQGILNPDKAYNCIQGTYGTGALYLTDRSVWIMAAAELTRAAPLIRKGGLVGGFLRSFLQVRDERLPVKADNIGAIRYSDILGAGIDIDQQNGQPFLRLATAVQTYEISEAFAQQAADWLTGINMGRGGKLAAIWSEPPSRVAPSPAQSPSPSAEVVTLLKQLGALRDAGVLTEAEFAQKKQELLARL